MKPNWGDDLKTLAAEGTTQTYDKKGTQPHTKVREEGIQATGQTLIYYLTGKPHPPPTLHHLEPSHITSLIAPSTLHHLELPSRRLSRLQPATLSARSPLCPCRSAVLCVPSPYYRQERNINISCHDTMANMFQRLIAPPPPPPPISSGSHFNLPNSHTHLAAPHLQPRLDDISRGNQSGCRDPSSEGGDKEGGWSVVAVLVCRKCLHVSIRREVYG